MKEDEQRKAATTFRKFLLDDGFQMLQFSVYARPCVSFARQHTHIQRIRTAIPPEGEVRIFFVTRAQWAKSLHFHGKPAKKTKPEAFPEQLLLWE